MLPAPLVNQTARPKATRLQMFVAICCGLLPYLGGLLVTLTRRISLLALAGTVICVVSTSVAYALRKSTDRVAAKQRLMVDPFLYGFEFALTAVCIRYVFMHHGEVLVLHNVSLRLPVILCVLGAILWFWLSLMLRIVKLRNKPHTSRVHLSLEERQEKIRIGSWIALGVACVFMVGAMLIAWLQHTGGR
jgi:hypothetical protein